MTDRKHHDDEWPADVELLLGWARPSHDAPGLRERIVELAGCVTDWSWFLHAAESHGVGPLVFKGMTAVGRDLVPAGIFQALQSHYHANAMRCRALTAELIRILDLFAGEGIDIFPFKGPALSMSAYGDPTLRHYLDLDVFIRREDLGRALTLLTAGGFKPQTKLDERILARPDAFADTEYHVSLARPGGLFCPVEVHWAFSRERRPGDPAGGPALWPRLEPVELGDRTVRSLPAADLLAYLCLHGGKHHWGRLEWICVVAGLIRRTPGPDWDAVLARARAFNAETHLLKGLHLAGEWLDAVLPDPVRQRIAGNHAAVAIPPETCTWLTRKGQGFHATEATEAGLYHWTNGRASLELRPPPGLARPALHVRLDADTAPGRDVEIRIAGESVLKESIPPGYWERTLPLPDRPANERTVKVEILSVAPAPAAVDPTSDEGRRLGVRVWNLDRAPEPGHEPFDYRRANLLELDGGRFLSREGFYGSENSDAGRVRWTSGHAEIRLPGCARRGCAALQIDLAPAKTPPADLEIRIDGASAWKGTVRSRSRRLVLPLSTAGGDRDLSIELISTTFEPPPPSPDATDSRKLGVWVRSVRLIENPDAVVKDSPAWKPTVAEQVLMIAALALRATIALALKILPYRAVRPLLKRALRGFPAATAADSPPDPAGEARVEAVACAVRRAERIHNPGRCLERSLTGYVLLRLVRQPCRLCLGVGRAANRDLFSHAWVESRGRVILSGAVDALAPMPVRPADVNPPPEPPAGRKEETP